LKKPKSWQQISRDNQQKRKASHNEKHDKSDFKIDEILKYKTPDNHPNKNELSPAFVAPCGIIEKLGAETYNLEQLNPTKDTVIRTFVAHSNDIRPYFDRIG
jgi:hypothetical protein